MFARFLINLKKFDVLFQWKVFITIKTISAREIRELLAQRNFAPRKSLGQNFLLDRNILEKIARAAELDPGDRVLEIGPGLGALTDWLLEAANRVVAVEYDRGLHSILEERLAGNEKLRLLREDFMEVDLAGLTGGPAEDAVWKVVANLPYYITTPAIFKLVESEIPWRIMVFLVQKEVADRMVAPPGGKEYGSLSVMLNFYGRVEKVAAVPKTVFYPAPQVDSAIVRIRPEWTEETRVLYPFLHRVVQAVFGQRRKTLLNALTGASLGAKETIGILLDRLGIDPGRRGETLTGSEFEALARAVRDLNAGRC
jgi:16S rRNA (adenine1518-N6/adenine1519-N6)-dimethyltransferase